MSHRPIIHPLLLALFPLLTLFSHNQAELGLRDLWMPLLVYVGGAGALWGVATLLVRSASRAAMLVSCFTAFFFLYVPVISPVLLPLLGRHRFVLVAWAALLLVALLLIARTRRDLRFGTALLNNVALAMLLLPTGRLVLYEVNGRANAEQVLQELLAEEQPLPTATPLGYAPDIYYIVPDRYGGTDVLTEVLQYDNSGFIEALRQRGFFVAEHARANYPTTPLSLASALNMEYLQRTAQLVGEDCKDSMVTFGLIKNNRVQRLLRQRGYRYVHMGGRWTATRHSAVADENIAYDFPLSEFNMELVLATAAAPLLYGRVSTDALHRQQVLHRLEAIQHVPQQSSPKFVFLHLLVPHTPYVFDHDGSLLSEAEAARLDEHEKYRRQVTYVNQALLETIDSIREQSERPPVIIVQADEGPHFEDTFADRMSEQTIRTKASILNAILAPGADTAELPEDMTPVNNFRFVFRAYFGADFPPLDDRTYWFEDPLRPYRNADVTDIATTRER